MPRQLYLLTAFVQMIEKVYPVAPPPEQMQEIRRAFMGGAKCMGELLTLAVDVPEPIQAIMLSEIKAEMDQFCKDVREGRA